MKQTQVIFLTFATGLSTDTARVNVPFKVKTLHTKALSLTTGDTTLSTGEYITIESDLVNNAPLGSTFNISTYSANCSQDIENQYWNPRVVQGEYTFVMKRSNGTLYPASTGGDSVALVIEFNGPDEII